MNIETGEIKNYDELTDEERRSGKWALVPKWLAKKWGRERPVKVPKDSADFAAILKAEERRKRRAAKRRPAA